MPQLAGLRCVHCSEYVEGELSARFCPKCRNPVHNECAERALPSGPEGSCPACGAPPAKVVEVTRQDRSRAAAERADSGMRLVALGFACMAGGLLGGVLCSGMSLAAGNGRLVMSAWPFLVGIFLMVRGLRRSRSSRPDESPARPASK